MVIFGVFSPILSAPYFLAFSVVLFFWQPRFFFLLSRPPRFFCALSVCARFAFFWFCVFLLVPPVFSATTFVAYSVCARFPCFLDAFSHLYKRVCPSVGPSVRRSVGRSVRPSVRRSHTSWLSVKWTENEQNSTWNKIVCHLREDWKTSTWAVCENASVVRTLFDLFSFCFLGHHGFMRYPSGHASLFFGFAFSSWFLLLSRPPRFFACSNVCARFPCFFVSGNRVFSPGSSCSFDRRPRKCCWVQSFLSVNLLPQKEVTIRGMALEWNGLSIQGDF